MDGVQEDKAPVTNAGIKSFLSGGFGGVACVLVGQPFDIIKTRLQTAAPGQYTGAMDAVRKTMAKDGVKGYVRDSTYCFFSSGQHRAAFMLEAGRRKGWMID